MEYQDNDYDEVPSSFRSTTLQETQDADGEIDFVIQTPTKRKISMKVNLNNDYYLKVQDLKERFMKIADLKEDSGFFLMQGDVPLEENEYVRDQSGLHGMVLDAVYLQDGAMQVSSTPRAQEVRAEGLKLLEALQKNL